jgi:phosphate transport system substrate-binding protein
MNVKRFTATAAVAAAVWGCGGGGGQGESGGLGGTVHIDGSSTVFPITEAVAEEFGREHRDVRVTVGISGTGGGFKKFLLAESDINDASRAIKEAEADRATAAGIEFIELPVAYDGISVVVHPDNPFVDHFTVEELEKIWQPGSTVQRWSDIRPGWPTEEVRLYGPGVDSGTFDYFTEAVNGKAQVCRADFTASEDDNVLVKAVSGDKNSLGFFGFAYYAENETALKAVLIDGGAGPVAPSFETINNGTYSPLSRPIFIYVNRTAADRAEVNAFVDYYLEHARLLVTEVGYVPLPDRVYDLARERFAGRVTGSAFLGKETMGVKIEDVLAGGR